MGLRRGWFGRGLKRVFRALLLGLIVLLAIALYQAWEPIGHGPSGFRLVRMEASKQWAGDHFENPQPLWNDNWGAFTGMFGVSDDATPHTDIPFEAIDGSRFRTPPPSGLRVTWLGHSTLLLEIDGRVFLTDPVWSSR